MLTAFDLHRVCWQLPWAVHTDEGVRAPSSPAPGATGVACTVVGAATAAGFMLTLCTVAAAAVVLVTVVVVKVTTVVVRVAAVALVDMAAVAAVAAVVAFAVLVLAEVTVAVEAIVVASAVGVCRVSDGGTLGPTGGVVQAAVAVAMAAPESGTTGGGCVVAAGVAASTAASQEHVHAAPARTARSRAPALHRMGVSCWHASTVHGGGRSGRSARGYRARVCLRAATARPLRGGDSTATGPCVDAARAVPSPWPTHAATTTAARSCMQAVRAPGRGCKCMCVIISDGPAAPAAPAAGPSSNAVGAHL